MKYTPHTDSIVNVCDEDLKKKEFIQSKTNCLGREDKDDPFFLCDLGDVVNKFWRWQKNLPQVQPYYAVKCNPDPIVLKVLANLGVNFDCASKKEIQAILDLGVHPDRIIYANPCKQTSFIKYAEAKNVKKMTFDNENELHKIKQNFPLAELILRIRVDDSKALCQFGIKFGASVDHSKHLLEVAKTLELNVIGVSFHVGSGCYDASAFYDAVSSAAQVFKVSHELGFEFTLLDIGGGFPGVEGENISFETTAVELKRAFKKYFSSGDVKIIAEPGRYFVASAFTLSCNVIAVREVHDGTNTQGFMYYLNDGVYGSFNCTMFDHQYPQPYSLFETDGCSWFPCSVWGPTCDSMDCITKQATLPKLAVGNWLSFDDMGAYTNAAASKFNGFNTPLVIYMCYKNMYPHITDCLASVTMPVQSTKKRLLSQNEAVCVQAVQ